MDDTEFDRALIAAAFEQAGQRGWNRLSIVQAARDADLPLDRARQRFPGPGAVLMRFGLQADQAVLAGAARDGALRDRLFDMVMRRIDVLQAHRSGMVALLRWLPTQPIHATLLAMASLRSMAWTLEAAGLQAAGLTGALRTKGLLAVWLWTVRAWKDDTSEDLSATMAALDRALDRAEQADASLAGLFRPTPRPPTDAARGPMPDTAPSDPPPEPPPEATPDLFPDTSPPTPQTPDVPPTAAPGDFNAE